jgi:Myotubularin protein
MSNIKLSLEKLHETSIMKRKEAEEFLKVLREWSLAEDLYSKTMARVSNHRGISSPYIQDFENLRAYTRFVSENSKKISDTLNDRIIDHFKALITTQSHSIKISYIEGKKIGEYINKKQNLITEAKNKYFNTCRDCEQIAFDLDKESNQARKEKLLQKFISSIKDVDLDLNNYRIEIESYNSNLKKYLKSIDKIVEAYNFYEEKRCKCLEESLGLIHQTLPSVQGLLTCKLKPFVFDSSEFLQNFTIENYDGSHPLFKTTEGLSLYLDSYLLGSNGCPHSIQSATEELYKSEIGKIVTKAWEGSDLTSEDYAKLNLRLKEPVGRKAWSWNMNLRRTQGDFKLNEKGYNKIVEIMLATLNECERTQDTGIIKNCIILSETFYKELEDNKKVYLQSSIISHSIWNDLNFWDQAIESAINDQLKKQSDGKQKNDDDEDIVYSEKNLVFSQLVSFGNIMISFKLSATIAKNLLGKYAAKYRFSRDETDNIMYAVHESL